ncbi:hypothetical protein R3I94_008581 [Phoxinus phoxinus]
MCSATAASRSDAAGDRRERFTLWINALSVLYMREECGFTGTRATCFDSSIKRSREVFRCRGDVCAACRRQ